MRGLRRFFPHPWSMAVSVVMGAIGGLLGYFAFPVMMAWVDGLTDLERAHYVKGYGAMGAIIGASMGVILVAIVARRRRG